jgi:cell division protein FtsL
MIQVISERFIHTNILAQQRVEGKANHRWFPALTIGCLITFVIVCFFAFLWIRVNILQTGYQISRSLEEQERMKQENNALRVERSALMTTARIEKIARGELGMVTPQAKQVIVLEW